MNTPQEDGHPGGPPEGKAHRCGGRGQTILARHSAKTQKPTASPRWQHWPCYHLCHSGMGALPDHTGHANSTRKRTMHKDVVYARLYAAFFQAHPEMLTEVRYVPMPDGEEPSIGKSNGLFHRPRPPTPCHPAPADARPWGRPARPALPALAHALPERCPRHPAPAAGQRWRPHAGRRPAPPGREPGDGAAGAAAGEDCGKRDES
jgi:hypothetical protein